MSDRGRLGNGWNPVLVLGTCVALVAGCEEDPVQPGPDLDAQRTALVALYEATDGPAWVRKGRIRGILRGASALGLAGGDSGGDLLPLQGLEVLSSRGIPGSGAWRR